MRAVAIEYDVPGTNGHKKGYLRIPDNFPASWCIGFMEYIRDKNNMKPSDEIHIYPYTTPTTEDRMGWTPQGYTSMKDDFILALRNKKYYPQNSECDVLRRMYTQMASRYYTFSLTEK